MQLLKALNKILFNCKNLHGFSKVILNFNFICVFCICICIYGYLFLRDTKYIKRLMKKNTAFKLYMLIDF